FYGMLVAIPTGIISGPLLARVISRGVTLELPEFEQSRSRVATPSKAAALTVVLMPVVLIALGQIVAMMPQPLAGHLSWLGAASDPVLALLIANLAALPLLFGRRVRDADLQDSIWSEAVMPAGAILLAIGADRKSVA